MLKLETITNQLGAIHTDLSFTIERVNAIEETLGITALTQEQADELNESPTMKDDEYIDPNPFKAGIVCEYTEVDRLSEENKILKDNLEINIKKLNYALEAVAQMQRALKHSNVISDIIPVEALVAPAKNFRNEDNVLVPPPSRYI